MSVTSEQFLSIVSFRRMETESVRRTIQSYREEANDVFISICLDRSTASNTSIKSKIENDKHCLMCNIM